LVYSFMFRAVFMGSDTFSLPILEALISGGRRLSQPVELVGVVTQPDRTEGRGRKLAPNAVKQRAVAENLVVLQPERLRNEDTVQSVLALRPDLIVVASFGQILPRALYEAPRFKCLNLHPSLLPRYRGASPITAPILAGDDVTGVTLMQVSMKMDAGPIVSQVAVRLDGAETAGELEARLARKSADLLLRDLPAWLEGLLEPLPQDEGAATYTAKLTKHDGLLDWRDPADTLARRVRAFNPWPAAYTFLEGRQLRVLRAGVERGAAEPGIVVDLTEGRLLVGTSRGLLAVQEAQFAGGRALDVDQLVRGHPGLRSARFDLASPW